MKTLRGFIATSATLTLALALSACGGSSNNEDDINPFAEGELLEVMQGDWFGNDCVQDLDNNTSTIEKMEFKFREPLSWKDDFFKDDSLEFTGSFEAEVVTYDNAYCLGSGSNSQKLIESEVALNNLSIIETSITSDSFKAFYAQEKNFDFDLKLDVGSGLLLEFRRGEGGFIIDVLNAFTYQGVNFDLQDLDDPLQARSLLFSKADNPISTHNIDDVSDQDFKSFLQSPIGCGELYMVNRMFKNSIGEYQGLLVLAQSHSTGMKFLMVNRDRSSNTAFQTEFQTTHLDWVYTALEVQTEKGFSFSHFGSELRIKNEPLNLNQTFEPTYMSTAEVLGFLSDRKISSELFDSCN